MTLAECLLIVIALAMLVFAAAEYEGTNLKVLTAKNLLCVCLIFFLGQMIAMGAGYLITRLPFFARHAELSLPAAYPEAAAVLFLFVGGFIFYKTWKWRNQEEHLRELVYGRIAFEAVMVALYTLIAGVGCGLLEADLALTFLIVCLTTILAVVAGLYTGYSQGDRFHRLGYGVSCALFVLTGIKILMRYM